MELTVPVPPTSCQIPTQTTNRVLEPVTVCEYETVLGPALNPVATP